MKKSQLYDPTDPALPNQAQNHLGIVMTLVLPFHFNQKCTITSYKQTKDDVVFNTNHTFFLPTFVTDALLYSCLGCMPSTCDKHKFMIYT